MVILAGNCGFVDEVHVFEKQKLRDLNLEMDVGQQAVGTNIVKDAIGERCQKLFQDFLEE